MLKWARKKSPWIYHLNCGGCNGCDIELIAALTPLYDAERFGVLLRGSPRHADIITLTGPLNRRNRDKVLRVLEQTAGPKKILVIGSCAISKGIFSGSPNIAGPIDRLQHVDAYVPGCPSKPQAILNALLRVLK